MSETAMQAVDCHCHLAHEDLDDDRAGVLARAAAAGVGGVIGAGTHPDDWARQRELGAPGVALAFGVHPWWVEEADPSWLAQLREQLDGEPRPAAVGEIGLDRPRGGLREQQRWLDDQLALAAERELPVVLHVVGAHGEALAALKRCPVVGGIVHGFDGGYPLARSYLDHGLDLSLGRWLGEPRRTKLRDAVRRAPLERLLLESDAPHGLAEPAGIRAVAATLAELRGLEADEVLARCGARARELFGLTDHLQGAS